MAEFTGERVIPGQVDIDLFNEHLGRYKFASRLAKRRRVLDAGCGTGFGSAELGKAAASVLGIDVAAEAVEYAREHYGSDSVRFETASIEALPVADASIDLVVAFEVIEHLENWPAFLAEARRVLAPGGQLIVSTPNKLYYAESRRLAGPNPFHVHEFEYEEFRDELAKVFPHVAMFVENHSESVVFQPVAPDSSADVRVDGVPTPAESHFFVAVCALGTQTGAPTFVWVPSSANLLRERERHIQKLEGELATKDEWLDKAKAELATLNDDHQKVLALLRSEKEQLEERNRWAEQLNAELNETRERIGQLQQEAKDQHAAAQAVADGYEAKVAELEADAVERAKWAVDLEARLTAELTRERATFSARQQEADQLIEERTKWAQSLDAQVIELERQLSLVKGSRWMKLGRSFGLGPVIEQ